MHYLTTLWSKVFLKPDSNILKENADFVFQEKNKSYVFGIFVEYNTIDGTIETKYGSRNEFYFVNKMEISDYNNANTNDKQKYRHKIDFTEIISIEIIFDNDFYNT
jgi:hypothetical protein